ncbi:J domain-containing protein [Dehalococcoides mccartyi]|uniref:Molecular chaperone, DnaJ-family n=1 Tax=Dehalococcoides mccartyi (strain VS) TaxID=311424 RepID=D2BGD3_DEHMV|nr:J domain-containing protein [Dehalococcoides mccartyi]ACZ61383.1 molecular chaperone, DnaJ-family [Dehalococcoides mccartyi VS]
MTDATAEMMSGWLNQMFEGLRNDPVIGELWSAMKAETQSRHQAVVDPYRVIGLDKTSADDQVKKRYRDLMVKLHPDTAGVKGTEFLFQLVMAAYQQISKERGWR